MGAEGALLSQLSRNAKTCYAAGNSDPKKFCFQKSKGSAGNSNSKETNAWYCRGKQGHIAKGYLLKSIREQDNFDTVLIIFHIPWGSQPKAAICTYR